MSIDLEMTAIRGMIPGLLVEGDGQETAARDEQDGHMAK